MAVRLFPLTTFVALSLVAAFALSSADARAQTAAVPSGGCPTDEAGSVSQGAPAAKPVRQPGDWAWLCRYREENRVFLAEEAPLVVFVGDSITENWTSADPQFFARRWVGRGISGQTSSQILLRFHQDAIALKPRVIHLLVGANDVARNAGALDAQAFQGNMRAMIDLACAHNITMVVGAILPAERFYWRREIQPVEEIRNLNRWLRELAVMHRIRFVDYYAPMATSEGAMRPELSDDGVHPNQEGYRVMRRTAEPALAAAFARARGSRNNDCAAERPTTSG